MTSKGLDLDDEPKPEDVCFECGAHCCKLGGVVATKKEVDAIVADGHLNHFKQLAENVYGTDWGTDGDCPYLTNNKCSIYAVRPLGCRMFPVVQTISNGIILVECPLGVQLSHRDLVRRKHILSRRSNSFLSESEHHREEHIRELMIRSTRFPSRKIS